MNVFEEILAENPTQETKKYIPSSGADIDPRPDLREDHHHWTKILINAQAMFDEHKLINGNPTSLFKILHGLRCAGVRMEETKQLYKLHPGNEEYNTSEAWEEEKRRWLDPVKEDLVALFKSSKIGQFVNEPLPPGVFEETSAAPKPEQINLFGGKRIGARQ